MKKIMLATDFSERSDRALRRAVLLAHQTGAGIDLVHVVDDDRHRRIVDHEVSDARALLKDLSYSLRVVNGIPCRTHVLLADPFAGIVKAVEKNNPDLLVLGPHRRQLLRDVFIGTTAERTIRSVPCPVLMANGPPIHQYAHIMLTTDLSDNARRALRHFQTLKMAEDIRLSILHVFDAMELRLAMSERMPDDELDTYLDTHRAETRRKLSEFIAAVGGRRADPIVQFEERTVAAEILRTAEDLKSDLVVLATHDRGRLARMLLGSVTEQVLRTAEVDVLAIPPRQSP